MHPIAILLIGIATVLGLIIVLRANAFIALIAAAMIVSLLAPGEIVEKFSRVAGAFGAACGEVGIVIAFAAIIGQCMMDSGAADRLVRSFLGIFGERRKLGADGQRLRAGDSCFLRYLVLPDGAAGQVPS